MSSSARVSAAAALFSSSREIRNVPGIGRLIGRYFGGKEQLFRQVVEHAYADHLMMPPAVNAEAAKMLLSEPTREHYDGMLFTLRSAANDQAAQIMRGSLERDFQHALAEELDGPDAEARAALLVVICTGVQFMRNVQWVGHVSSMGSEPFTEIDRRWVRKSSAQ